MKKLFSTVCITFCLLFSSAATAVRAGDGHDPGYVCVETVDCPSKDAPSQEQGKDTSGSNSGAEDSTADDLSTILLELVNALLPKI